MNYEENKIAYILIVGASLVVLMGIITFLPFIILGAIFCLMIAGLLHGFGRVGNYYYDSVKPRIDSWLEEKD